MDSPMKYLTAKEKEIVALLNIPPYTPAFLEEWINRKDRGTPVEYQVCMAYGFYQAVHALAEKYSVAA